MAFSGGIIKKKEGGKEGFGGWRGRMKKSRAVSGPASALNFPVC